MDNKSILLDIIHGPKKHLLLGTSAHNHPKGIKNRLLAFRVNFNDKPIRLCLYVEGYYYDRFNANAVIANAKLVIPDQRAKSFRSQVQVYYDCTCASGQVRIISQTAA